MAFWAERSRKGAKAQSRIRMAIRVSVRQSPPSGLPAVRHGVMGVRLLDVSYRGERLIGVLYPVNNLSIFFMV